METDFCLILGDDEGVRFKWIAAEFVLSLGEAKKVQETAYELLERYNPALPAFFLISVPDTDDLTADIYVGKKYIRYGGHRFPCTPAYLFENLQVAINKHQEEMDMRPFDLDFFKSA